MHLKTIHLACFLLLLSAFCACGNKDHKKEEDRTTIDTLNSLAHNCIDNNSELALDLADSALQLSKKIDDDTLIARSLNTIGLIYQVKGQNDLAFHSLSSACNIYNTLKYHKGQAIVYTSIAMLFKKEGNYSRAIDTLEKALLIDNMGLYIDHDSSCIEGLLDDYINLGELYRYDKKYDSAIKYLSISLSGIGTFRNTKGIILGNLGNTYCDSGLYSDAEKMFDSALQINDLDEDTYAEVQLGIAKVKSHNSNQDSAIVSAANLALNAANKNGNNTNLLNTADFLAHYYSNNGHYINSADSVKKYESFKLNRLDSLSSIVTRFESVSRKLKEKEIESAREDKEQEKLVKVTITTCCILILAVLMLIAFQVFEKVYRERLNKIPSFIFSHTPIIVIVLISETIMLGKEYIISKYSLPVWISFFILQVPVVLVLHEVVHRFVKYITRIIKQRINQLKLPQK